MDENPAGMGEERKIEKPLGIRAHAFIVRSRRRRLDGSRTWICALVAIGLVVLTAQLIFELPGKFCLS